MSFLSRFFRKHEKPPKEGDLFSTSEAKITEKEACEIAMEWAKFHKVLFNEPIIADYRYRSEGTYWLVRSNAYGKGGAVLMVDDGFKKVVNVKIYPR